MPIERKLRPFFYFYGGKYRAAPRYPEPRYDTIIEPFAGSAGYSLRYHDKDVILVDKDPNIVNTWRYLIRVTPNEIRSLPDVLAGQTVDDFSICEEARILIGWWLNAATTRPMKSPSKWMRGKTRPSSFWGPEIRHRLANQVESIRHWRIIEGGYECAPDIEATWVIDPPYAESGKHYRYGSRDIDYASLANWCKLRKGQTMVCEQAGADWLPFRKFMDIRANPSCRGKGVSKEILWERSDQG